MVPLLSEWSRRISLSIVFARCVTTVCRTEGAVEGCAAALCEYFCVTPHVGLSTAQPTEILQVARSIQQHAVCLVLERSGVQQVVQVGPLTCVNSIL